jgi:hypothetical protein
VWCIDFHYEGVFIGVNGTSTDLERSVLCQVVAGRPGGAGIYRGEWDLHRLGEISFVLGGGRPAEWSGLHRRGLLLLVRSTKELGRPLGPLDPSVKYTPVVMMILTFGQLHIVIP